MSTRTKAIFILAYALHLAWIVLLASVPPVSRDALTHHLAVPKLWVEHGGVYEIPEIAFSYYPQLLDLLYTVPLALGHDIAAKYIHFTFALLTALLIFLFVRRRIGAGWGALAGLMFLTVPLIVKLSVTVYVDLGLIFFTTAALFSTVIWLEDPNRMKWLLLAGICSGLALSTKYNAIVSFLVLALLLPFFFLKIRDDKHEQQANAVKFGLIFVAVSLLVVSPWLIRNYSLTGNPIYPLQQRLFASQPAAQASTQSVRPLGPLLTRKLVHEESLAYTLLIPLRIFYEGKDDDPKYFDGRLNLLLLLLPLALLPLVTKEKLRFTEIPFFGVYSLLLVLLVFLTKDMRVRWVASIVPPLVVLSTYGLYAIDRRAEQALPSRAAAFAVTAVLFGAYLAPNVLYSRDLYRKIDPLPYVAGEVSRADYIRAQRPEYAVIARANTLVPPGRKVLGLFLGHRRYYFSVDATVQNNVFTGIAEKAGSAEGIAEHLTGLGYSHLVIHTGLFRQWLDSADTAVQARVAEFARYRVRQVMVEQGYGLYEIRAPAGAANL